jgi:hypothetical protein
MSLLSPQKNNIKYFQSGGRPNTFVYVGTAIKKGLSDKEGRSLSDLKKYYKYYRGDNTVFASVNATAFNTVMVGYNVHSDNKQAEILIRDVCDYIGLSKTLLEATINVLIFGDAYLEKRRIRKGDVVKLFPVNPQTMIINYDQFGTIQSYQQEIDGRKAGVEVRPEDIIHIRFFPIPGSPYGVSILEPNLDIIDMKQGTNEALYNAIRRHGTRKLVVTVGDEKDGQLPPSAVMEDIKTKLEDINEINEFIVPWMIKFSTIDEKGIQGIEEYYNYFLTQLITGLMCPEEALGLGKGSTEATARVKAILYERMIKAYQLVLSETLREELFAETLIRNNLLDQNGLPVRVSLIFNSVTDADEAEKAKWLSNIIGVFQGTDMPFTKNEIRKILGFLPLPGMDNVIAPTGGNNVPIQNPQPNPTQPNTTTVQPEAPQQVA